MLKARALHYVLKIGDRTRMIQFLRDLLGMKVLRHEEFEKECAAQCNGPYDGRWSKTMIGYGPEDDNFVLELTYNYGVGGYKLGNDLVGIQIESKAAYQKVLKNEQNWIFMHKDPETLVISSPANYLFEIRNPEHEQDLITKVALSSSNLSKSRQYWHELLGMKVLEESDRSLKLAYDPKEARLELVGTNGREVKRETAYGRMAFACAEDALTPLQEKVLEQKQTVLTKLVSLDTPGKATVQVVILADPDGHEICFVGEKGFSDLSQVDPKANELLEEAMEKDKSDEWFAKHKQSKKVE